MAMGVTPTYSRGREVIERFLRLSLSLSPSIPRPPLVIAAVVLLVSVGANAQLVTGSIAVLQSAGDYIVISADSKSFSQQGVSYHRCKVVALDDQLVYAATGYTSRGDTKGVRSPRAWDASEIVKQEYRSLLKTPRHEHYRKLAEIYGTRLAARLNDPVKAHPEEGWPMLLAAAVFAGFDEKQQRVVIEVKVERKSDIGVSEVGFSTKIFPAGDAVFALVIGETDVAQEFAAGRTFRSQSWRNGLEVEVAGLGMKERLVAGAEKIVQLTAKYQPSLVGGPMDTVLVSRNMGVKWIRRKTECAKGFGR